MNVFGFDFGTTNSLISVVQGNRSICFLDDEDRPIPSVVCYEGAQKILGRDAKDRLAKAGLGVQGNIVQSPKMYLGRDSVFVEGVERTPVDMVSDVVLHVRQHAQNSERNSEEISAVVVTIPVGMKGFQRRALRDAFKIAGLSILQFVHEPLAALYGLFRSRWLPELRHRYNGKLILVFDWGGGTLDLTLCRAIDDMIVQLKNDGTDEVGGDVFDETIMNRLLQEIRKTRSISDSVETFPGATSRLLHHCERAKIDLSTRSKVAIYVDSFFSGVTEEEFDYVLNQRDLEQVVKPLLDKGFERIRRILKDAGYSLDEVALCVATGGMSNMPAIKLRLHEWFGPERVAIPDSTATLISEGAAWIAADAVRLLLSKNIELELARNSFLPLVKAGTLMPREHEEQTRTTHLYCTDPRDGMAKFQLCAPKRPGKSVLRSEPRDLLDVVSVEVDSKAQAFNERLELDTKLNDDLILKVHARSLNQKDEGYCEIHDLEFGLKLPFSTESSDSTDTLLNQSHLNSANPPAGAIGVRPNVSEDLNHSLVPGEFLYQYNPSYFDVRRNPPELQIYEKLYYERCSLCGRASNDPACHC